METMPFDAVQGWLIYSSRRRGVGPPRQRPSLRARPAGGVAKSSMFDVAQIGGGRRARKKWSIKHRNVIRHMLPRFKNTTAQLVLLAFHQGEPS
jgi:hypothetical protein